MNDFFGVLRSTLHDVVLATPVFKSLLGKYNIILFELREKTIEIQKVVEKDIAKQLKDGSLRPLNCFTYIFLVTKERIVSKISFISLFQILLIIL